MEAKHIIFMLRPHLSNLKFYGAHNQIRTDTLRILSSLPLPGWAIWALMVPVERIELPTFGLQDRCTTAVLNWQNRKQDCLKMSCLTSKIVGLTVGPIRAY